MKSKVSRTCLALTATIFLGISLFVSDAAAFGNGNGVEAKNAVQSWDMTWSGQVDDRVQIRVQNRNARVRVLSGQSVRGASSNFRSSLPRRNVNVRVNKRDGRGDVRVIEQPSSRNNYTALIEIYDDKGGSDNYRFELTWDGGGYNDYPNQPNRPDYSGNADMTWQGRVDDRVRVTVRGRNASARALSGRQPTQVRSNFRNQLPRNNVRVDVRKRDGRGSVRVIQQPSSSNNYSAVVEIYDSNGGDDFYSFELNWDQGYGNDRPDYGNNYGQGMTWSGSVDDVVRISIRGNRVSSRIISGQSLRNERFDINKTLTRQNLNVRVDKRSGRGSVRVIQQPRSSNNYTAVIEIRDSKGGRDDYRIEADW